MSTIALEFRLGPDWESRAIARFGHGPGGWSHVANVLADGRFLDARSDTLAGVKPGIHIRAPDSEAWVKRQRATLEVSAAVYDAWEANLRAKIGDVYALWDILGFFLDRMLHRPATYDCSALAVNALQHVGLVPFPLEGFPAHECTPNDVCLIAQVAGFTLGPVETPEVEDPRLQAIDR